MLKQGVRFSRFLLRCSARARGPENRVVRMKWWFYKMTKYHKTSANKGLIMGYLAFVKSLPSPTRQRYAIASFILGYLLVGFIFGVIVCSGCNKASDYLFGSVVIGILSIVMFGVVPKNESGFGGSYVMWPYIFILAAMLFVLFTYLKYRKANN